MLNLSVDCSETTAPSKKEGELLSSALRCFDVLELMNSHRSVSIPELSKLLKLPRTTVMRSLRTLLRRGYISRTESGRYALTHEVNRLSWGWTPEEQALPQLRSILTAEARNYIWPLAIVLPHPDAMYIYAPTDALTPYKLISVPEGSRLSYMGTAAGAVYLAHCKGEERSAILRMAAEELALQDLPMTQLEGEMKTARAQGYLVKSEWAPGSARLTKICGGQSILALPIIVGNRIRGCLTARIITSAVPQSSFALKEFPRLHGIAAQLAFAWDMADKTPHVTMAAE